jgi:PhnB protein
VAKVKYKSPKGYSALTPYLVVGNAKAAIAFYEAAFDAKERYRLTMGDKIGHAELQIGDARLMLSDEFPQHGRNPNDLGGSPVSFTLYVADADSLFARAINAGAKVERPLEDQFYGDRSGRLVDPFGHRWSIQQRLEDVGPKQMQKRLDKMMSQGGGMAEAKAKSKATKRAAPGKTMK